MQVGRVYGRNCCFCWEIFTNICLCFIILNRYKSFVLFYPESISMAIQNYCIISLHEYACLCECCHIEFHHYYSFIIYQVEVHWLNWYCRHLMMRECISLISRIEDYLVILLYIRGYLFIICMFYLCSTLFLCICWLKFTIQYLFNVLKYVQYN